MRLRSVATAAIMSGLLVAVCLPATASAARRHGPHRNHGLTIATTANPIEAGDGVVIYGRLSGSNVSGQTIRLYHRIASRRRYTLIGTTTTDSSGYYKFTRAEGVVNTNRSWFVRAPGLHRHIHSRTIFERVRALVSVSASASTVHTFQRIVFSGTVTPKHRRGRVFLQTQTSATGNGWKTIRRGRLNRSSSYSIRYRFRAVGDRDVRVIFRRDRRNAWGASDPVTVSVQQSQVADFTIGSSSSKLDYGQSATISGTLYKRGTTTPDAGVSVRLWARTHGHAFHTVGLPQDTQTDGSYSFDVKPGVNTVYQVRLTAGRRHSARLFEGVRDVLSMNVSTTSATVGVPVLFTGTVSPDRARHAIFLERLGADGHWHVVRFGRIHHNSTYKLRWRFSKAGSSTFRVRIPSGPRNLGAVSSQVTVTATLPAVQTLPSP